MDVWLVGGEEIPEGEMPVIGRGPGREKLTPSTRSMLMGLGSRLLGKMGHSGGVFLGDSGFGSPSLRADLFTPREISRLPATAPKQAPVLAKIEN